MNVDIIIFSGQSNMQGQSPTLNSPFIVQNCYEYKYLTDEFVPLSDPVGENIRRDGSKGIPLDPDVPLKEILPEWLRAHALGASGFGYASLVPSFCKEYGKPTVAIHCAKGSTTIAEWSEGSDGYNLLMKKAKAGVKKAKENFTVEKIYFVWLQGESDQIEGNSEEYYIKKITNLKNSLKCEVGIDKFGIIRVGRFTKTEKDDAIINAQYSVCKTDPDFIMLSEITEEICQDEQNMNPYFKGHYSEKGYAKIGIAAANGLKVIKKDLN